jgi:hypothetical protein
MYENVTKVSFQEKTNNQVFYLHYSGILFHYERRIKYKMVLLWGKKSCFFLMHQKAIKLGYP